MTKRPVGREHSGSIILFGSRWRASVIITAVTALLLALLVAPADSAGARQVDADSFKAKDNLSVAGTVNGNKSATSRMAQTDRSLLGVRSSEPVNVVVKLDYDSTATYAGTIAGLPATSPSVTNEELDPSSSAVKRYVGHIQEIENRFLSALDARVQQAEVGVRLRTVYGGVALRLPANEVGELLELPGVMAVQEDSPEQLLTDSSPEFIGAPHIYDQLGETADDAGKGAIVGVLDSGAGPSTPHSRDHGNLPAPPPRSNGTPRTCDFGDNPLTPATDPFACQNKLIGGQPFLATYNAVFGGEVYPDSARDSNGHGTHTATTSAGRPGRERQSAWDQPRANPRNCTWCARFHLQSLRCAGLLPIRLGRSGRFGDHRPRRCHQLLDLRGNGPLRRSCGASLPRRLRCRRPGVRERRERRSRSRNRQSQLTVGTDGRGLHPGPDLPFHDHSQRWRWRDPATFRGHGHVAASTARCRWSEGRPRPTTTSAAPRRRPRGSSQARSSPVSAARAGSGAASTSSKAARRA